MLIVLLSGMLASAISMLGAWLLYRHASWTRRYTSELMALAAGVIIGSVFFHFLPELAVRAPRYFFHIAPAFLTLYVLQHHFAPHFHLTEAERPGVVHAALGWVAVVAFVVHAAFDGLSIGVGFATTLWVGISGFLAVLAHKLPEGVVIYTLLLQGGHSDKQALRMVCLIALVTPVVAVMSYLAGAAHIARFLPLGLAWAAGALLYIGASDLLPEIAHFRGWRKTMLVLAGTLLTYLMTWVSHG